jgi:hypothetical protein
MSWKDNERVEEILLIIGDSWQGNNRRWVYGLIGVLLLVLPVFFATKISFLNFWAAGYQPPKLLAQIARTPLEEAEHVFIKISEENYTGYIKLKNPNLDWGIPKFTYRIEVFDNQDRFLSSATQTVFVLPASEKYLIIPRFNAKNPPSSLKLHILESQFVLKPGEFPYINLDFQRRQIQPTRNDTTIVTGVLKNTSAFSITQVDLLALIYNDQSQIVGISYTNINDVLSEELRSFQLVWPASLEEAVHVELMSEVNMFAKDILRTQKPVIPF